MNDSHLHLPIPPGRRDEWAAGLAQPPPIEESSQKENFFVVRFGDEWFGIPPQLLLSTQPDMQPCRLPHRASSNVAGLVNADGRVVVCLAIEKIFGVLPDSGIATPRLLILQAQKWTFALRARHVAGVQSIEMGELQPLSEGAPDNLRQSARGVVLHGQRAITCLNAESFINRLMEVVR